MKATPSKQASLSGWLKKGAPKKKKEEEKTKAQSTEISSMKGGQMPPAVISTDSKVMDVDVDVDGRSSLPPESSRACRPCPIQGGGLCLWIREYIQLPPIPKDLQSEKHPHPSVRTKVNLLPYQVSHMVDYILLDEEQIVKPIAKKRRVITSDDENLSDDGPATMPSKTPKEAKRLSKAQAKLAGKSASRAQETGSKKVLAVEPAEDGAVDDVVSDEEELAAASTT